MAGPSTPRLRALLTSTGPGGYLARRLLPAAVVFPALLGALVLAGDHAGLYRTEVRTILFAVASMIFFGAVVLAAAVTLERGDAERRRAEQTLLQERYLLGALMDSVPDSVYFKDRDSRFIRINKSQAGRFGLSDPAQAVGKSDADFFNPEHASRAYADEQEVIRTGKALVAKEEHEFLPGGRERWASSTKMPLPDDQGRIVGTFGISRDITERKRAEEALRETEERLRLLLESTDEGIYGVDLEGRCTFINPAAAACLRYRPEEAIGQDMHALVHHHRPDGAPYPAQESPIVQALRTGRGSRVDRDVYWRHDGTSFPAEYACNPIRAQGGAIQGAVVTFTDSTERNRLRQLVVQSEKMASLGLLSAGIAHEINNPLAYVANNLVVLERDYQNLLAILDAYEAARDRLAQADAAAAARVQALTEEFDLPYVRANLGRLLARTREGVQRVARIVQSLRGLARTDRPELADVSVQELIEMSLEMLRGRLERGGTEVVLDLERAPRMRCVSTQFGQLLLNLLTNAMQAIEATGRTTGGRIGIASRIEGERILLEVADNGCGMPPEHLAKIFDPFFTTKAVGQGTGLGLAIAHGIVTGHGGRIEVESQPGQGTCFRIVLPRDPERGSV